MSSIFYKTTLSGREEKMFLTKKGLWKIVLMTLCYFVIGSVSIGAGVIFTFLGISSDILFVLGLICYVFCPIVIACGRYAEGKGKLINLGNKLVRNELKPNEFLKEYHKKRNCIDVENEAGKDMGRIFKYLMAKSKIYKFESLDTIQRAKPIRVYKLVK